MSPLKPILVTGSHRSGSTWVGKMIAAAPEVVYIHEPFKPVKYRPGVCGARFQYWFTYVNDRNESRFKSALWKTINLQYNWCAELREKPGVYTLRKVIRRSRRFRQHRLRGRVPLLKDPIALLSAEWLAQTFDMKVFILIRHPAAFVESIKRAHWEFPFGHLLDQPLLIQDRLAPFAGKIERYANERQDIISQACLLWRILYHVVHGYQQKYGDRWLFRRHEDLSQDPVCGFENIFKHLGLKFSSSIADMIREHSTANETSSGIKRDSKENIWKWKRRLTANEIATIRDRTQDVAQHFYADDDW